ncbi:MAG: glycerol-3-phosphate dehydrogenase/oxidase [Desulfomonilia bacterium]|jgi:glycerol-3-phosphate dehydrogenase
MINDIIIIGGGITGAAVAYEAASRGLKTALVEKKDFACATSAATSKLIHGGLRYLANAEFGLVRESLKERRTLENIAPNFVYPIPMMMVHDTVCPKNNAMEIGIGLRIYDALSYDRNRTWDKGKKIPPHRKISTSEALVLEPGIFAQGMKGASVFYDCANIFPERLTLAFIKSAVHHGAKVANYARVEGFIMNDNGKIEGVTVRDLLRGSLQELKAKLVINCAGPWADILLGLARQGTASGTLKRSEGIHIITKKIVNSHVVSYMTKEARHFFMVPWRGHNLIGTTDQPFTGNPDEYRVTRKSIEGLIDDVNTTLGSEVVGYDDILYTYGGLRPLVEDESADTYGTSRRYEIYDNAVDDLQGLITVEGGKFTTSRNLAEKAVDLMEKKLGIRHTVSQTAKRYLWGSQITDMKNFMLDIKHKNKDFDATTLEYLGKNYGTEFEPVLEIARHDQSLTEMLNDDGEILAQAVYAVRHEMARSLSDIVFRRTGIATLGNPGNEVLEKVALTVAGGLGWDDKRVVQEITKTADALKLPAN